MPPPRANRVGRPRDGGSTNAVGTPRIRNAVVLVVAAFVAGCAAQDEPPPPTTRGPETGAPPVPIAFDVLDERFDRHERLPDGWISESGEWTVVRNASAPSSPNVLRGDGGDNLSSSLRAPPWFAEFDATVLFTIVAGDGGAGLVFGQADDDRHIVRYTPRDSAWRLVSYEDGEAKERNGPDAPAGSNTRSSHEWVALRVLLEGTRLQAWHNAALVLDVADVGEPRAGQLGLFVARGTVATFDDLRVEPLTR